MAAGRDVKLLGFSESPYVLRAMIALNLKGVEYEYLVEEKGKKSGLLLESNPVYKKVPVLIHGGKPLCESAVIVQYIDEVWAASGPPILPTDPYDRAIARFWAAFIDDKLPQQTSAFLGKVDEDAKAEALEKFIVILEQLEEALNKCSNGKSFFGGDSIGYIDIALGCFLGWFKATEKIAGINLLDDTRVPGLVRWAESFCASDAVKRVMPETDQLVEFSKILRSLMLAKTATPSK